MIKCSIHILSKDPVKGGQIKIPKNEHSLRALFDFNDPKKHHSGPTIMMLMCKLQKIIINLFSEDFLVPGSQLNQEIKAM